MKTLTIELQDDISTEQYNMAIRVLEAMNIKVKKSKSQKRENPFNYDLERMKDRVENQEFHTKPKHIKNFEEFDKWLTGIAQS